MESTLLVSSNSTSNIIKDNIEKTQFSITDESQYKNENHTCFATNPINAQIMTIPIMVGNQSGEAFMDSGCTFNAVSTSFAERCKLKIIDHDNDLKCAVGGGQSISIKRRVAKCTFDLLKLGVLDTYVFVMDPIPLGYDVLFGYDFLETVNPNIDWKNRQVSVEKNTFANNSPTHVEDERAFNARMFFHQEQEYAEGGTNTLVINMDEYVRELETAEKNSDGSVFFVINPQDTKPNEKAQRHLDQNWSKLVDNPAFPILEKYRDSVFRDELTLEHVVRDASVQHTIDLIDDKPIVVKQFRLSPDQKTAVAAWTAQMTAAGLIRPSNSPYSSPIFCVKKPVGWRIVHDYRLLNAKTRIPQEPIPRKDDILDAMHGGYWFSCMDLLSGYYQLMLRDSDRACTAFSTPSGHYEYLVIAQGLAGAPATFNRFVQKVFNDLQDICRAFFDDIYIYTKSRDINEHLIALDRVLQKCKDFGLSIKLSKCVFLAAEIPVLGDFVGRKGVRMDPDKVAVIVSWPTPKTRTQLKSFLGTIQYCARFCPDYGKLVAPLHHATQGKRRQDTIKLTEEEMNCFHQLKLAMSNTPTLALPDFAKPFGIRMDASDHAIGGVLFQADHEGNEHPVAYAGRKLSRAEIVYPVREKELLAIIFALKIWRPYLIDHPFTVETDHQTLQALLTQQTCTQRLARWLNLISEYRIEFKWIPGNTNCTADGISRRADFVPEDGPASRVKLPDLLQSILDNVPPVESTINEPSLKFTDVDQALMVCQLLSSQDIRSLCLLSYPLDKNFGSVWEFFLRGGQGKSIENRKTRNEFQNFHFINGLLWKAMDDGSTLLLCIPDNKELRRKILFSEHDDPSRGHPGIYKTTKFIQRKYYWRNMHDDVKRYIQSCEKCQRNKYRQSKAPGLLNVLPIPEARWQHVTMDFIVSLPVSNGFNSIWVIVDRLTKRAHFIPVVMGDGDSSARACAAIFQKEYVRLHGIPETILSDRDCRFTSVFWQEFIKSQGSLHLLGSAFRPNTDGQTERTNRFIQDYVRNYVHARQDNWAELLFSAEFAYNSRVHDSIGMSPFEADLGYVPRSVPDHLFDKLVGTTSEKNIFILGQKQQKVMEILKVTLTEAQKRMKKYYDRNRPIQEFEVGDLVLVSSKNLDIEHLGIASNGTTKFGPLWIGPYPVVAKTTPDTYQIKLPIGLRLHPEFHTSLLKRHFVDSDDERLNIPNEGMISAGGLDSSYLIENIIDHKKVGKKIWYMIKWQGYPSDHNTWEELSNIRKPASGLIDAYLLKNRLSKATWNPIIRRSRTKQ